MKKLCILISLFVAIFIGCATTGKQAEEPLASCPDENVVYINTQGQLQWVPEGFFDGEPSFDGNYVTEEQFDKAIETKMKQEGM